MSDEYTTSARFYDDAYSVKNDLDDLPFYLDVVRRSGAPVLEIACGTGRILIEVAKAGYDIDGVDSSPSMLDILQRKITTLPAATRNRIRLEAADMRTLSLRRRYETIIIPFRPLQHLYTVDDQVAALTAARHHLEADGRLAFNVFYPNWAALEEVGSERLELEWTDSEDPSVRVRRFFVRDRLDRLNQVFEGRFIYRRSRDGRPLDEVTARLAMSYYTYPHLLALFRLAGLDIVEEYGSFQREPITALKEMIFVLRRA